jgi:extradiol dioxygenase family protein
VPHFGLVLTMTEFQDMAEKFRAHDIKFIIEPHLRFAGMPGEQMTM